MYITLFMDLDKEMEKLKPLLNKNAIDIKEKIKSIATKYSQEDSDVME